MRGFWLRFDIFGADERHFLQCRGTDTSISMHLYSFWESGLGMSPGFLGHFSRFLHFFHSARSLWNLPVETLWRLWIT